MKKCFIGGLVLGAQLAYGGDFIVFGDSLSDTGNLARFTHNSGKIYDENLASYFGEYFPSPQGGSRIIVDEVINKRPGFMKGPNYAVGGSTANLDLGMGNSFFEGSFIKMTGAREMKYFFEDKPQNIEKKKFVYWFGGNDLRLASEKVHEYTSEKNPLINKSIGDVKEQVKTLLDHGAKFVIVPNSPDMAYTPSFFKNFASTAKINGETLMGKKAWYKKDLPSTFLDSLVDSPETKDPHMEVVVKEAIRKILIAQGDKNVDSSTEVWFKKYKEERALVTDLVNYYNSGVDKALGELKRDGVVILRPDTNKTFNEIVKHPDYYGFTNITGTAVVQYSDAITNIKKWGSGTGDERAGAFEPEDGKGGLGGIDKPWLWGKGSKYAFSDPVHPSPEIHRMLSDYIITMMETKDGKVEDYSQDYDYSYGNYKSLGDIQEKSGKTKELNNYNFKSDGEALYALGKDSTIIGKNFNIESLGRVTSTVLAEEGGKIQLDHGSIKTIRGTVLSYPYSIRVNGVGSEVGIRNTKVESIGVEAVGVSVGNGGRFNGGASEILAQGNGIQMYNSTVNLSGTKVKSEKSGIWVFANKEGDMSRISAMGSNIDAPVALDVSSNVTGINPKVSVSFNSSIIKGDMRTSQGGESDVTLVRSKWNMRENSNVTTLKTRNSEIFFPEGDEFHKLVIGGDFHGGNSLLHMHGNLGGDNSPTDQLVVKGITWGRTIVDYKNHRGLGDKTKDGIKIIDLYGQGSVCDFVLEHPIYVGAYQYVLVNGINNPKDQEDFYLTSTLEKVEGRYYTPAMMLFSEPGLREKLIKSPKEEIRLLNPKYVAKSLGIYGNLENSLNNLEHGPRNNSVNFTVNNYDFKLKDSGKVESKIKGQNSRLEYPLGDKFGIYFTVNSGEYKMKDFVRPIFKKDADIGKIEHQEYGMGLYKNSELFKNLTLDSTLGGAYLENKFKGTEGLNDQEKGYGINLSEKVQYSMELSKDWKLIPMGQLDGVYEELGAHRDGIIRGTLGAETVYTVNRWEFKGALGAYQNLRNPDGIIIDGEKLNYHFKRGGVKYTVGTAYEIKDAYKITLDITYSEEISEKLGLEYKF